MPENMPASVMDWADRNLWLRLNMAINPASQYPGQITPASTDYPYGSARDVSSPGAGDGTPVQQAWVNDWFGFQQAVLAGSGITPSGNPDTAVASDVFDGLIGRLIGRKIFTASGTYTPTAGTKKIRIRGVGGGGAGGGTGASTASSVRGGGGGASGTYGELLTSTVPSSAAITIGAAGAGVSGGNGGNGGTTSFGTTLVLPGGGGGALGINLTGAARGADGGTAASAATGADISIRGSRGGDSMSVSATTIMAGAGSSNPLGQASGADIGTSTTSTAFSTTGSPARGYGAGGGGGYCGIGGGAAAGGSGGAGILIIEEFS